LPRKNDNAKTLLAETRKPRNSRKPRKRENANIAENVKITKVEWKTVLAENAKTTKTPQNKTKGGVYIMICAFIWF